MRIRQKKFKFKKENGKTLRFTEEQLVTAWNIIDKVDKVDTASLYLRNYCKFNADEFTCDEWWICCATICQLYAEKFNNGANDLIWKSACDDFMQMYKKGDVF